tara:strand:- start:17193 stop:17501 length:309 start_codon:yes stop_codon:yes gene_type:complete
MNRQSLLDQNEDFNGTMGVSLKNRSLGFIPAFRDERTGRVELARFRNGEIAPMHVIAGLPRDWATAFDEDGDVASLTSTIIAGFVRQEEFFTREQACAACGE